MNREQRRRYDRVMKDEPTASMCPKCQHKARRIRVQVDGGLHDIFCERCEEHIAQNVKLNVPNIRKAAER